MDESKEKYPEFLEEENLAQREANYYSLDNDYLTKKEKAAIEVWFQSPIKTFWIVYLFSYFFFEQVRPVFPAIYASLLIGSINTKVNAKFLEKSITIFYFLFNSYLLWALLIYLLIQNEINWVIAILLFGMDMTGILCPGHFVLGTWANKYVDGNPKYGAARAIFGIKKFAFEKFYDEKLHKQSIRGGRRLSYLYTLILVINTIIFIKPPS